jgi:glycerophosphoryl diester phosphodiesterase
MSKLIRVGHKGADLVAPGNTFESFQAALDAGVDMIEFDVLRLRDGRLVLAHDYAAAEKREPVPLEEGLDHFAGDAYANVELDVDMKLPGYEREVVAGLLSRGLADRALISSHYLESLEEVGRLAPGVRRGWSIPKLRNDPTDSPAAPIAHAFARLWRRVLPARAAAVIRQGRCEALMVHYLLASKRLVDKVRSAGGQVYVWTVDDAERIGWLASIGVDGVITNDPRLFEDADRGLAPDTAG